MIHTEIRKHTISVDDGISFVKHQSTGAICTFIGTVRDNNNGKKVTALEYECYVPMAENVLGAIARNVKQQFGVEKIYIAHRYGYLDISDMSVLICVSSAHRDDAFKACRHIIESIKKNAPLWKKEHYEGFPAQWVTCQHHTAHEHHIQIV